jgi:dTDP-glucose 4,6-dehydratase
MSNIEMAKIILKQLGKAETLLKFTEDRPGHDKRYAMNSYKLRSHTGWSNKYPLEDSIRDTVNWYRDNRNWWESRM